MSTQSSEVVEDGTTQYERPMRVTGYGMTNPGRPPASMGIIPVSVRGTMISILALTLLAVLVVAIHPWTFVHNTTPASTFDSGDSGFGGANQGGGGVVVTEDQSDNTGDGSIGAAGNTGAATQSPTDDSTDTATAEAGAITSLLTAAQTDRTRVVQAVSDASNCGNLSDDQENLQAAQADRSQLAGEAQNLAVGALPGAGSLPQELATALTDSAQADGYFLDWISDLQTSCDPSSVTSDSNYTSAESQSQTATQDKVTFLSTWNPIAQQYGQPTFSESDI